MGGQAVHQDAWYVEMAFAKNIFETASDYYDFIFIILDGRSWQPGVEL